MTDDNDDITIPMQAVGVQIIDPPLHIKHAAIRHEEIFRRYQFFTSYPPLFSWIPIAIFVVAILLIILLFYPVISVEFWVIAPGSFTMWFAHL